LKVAVCIKSCPRKNQGYELENEDRRGAQAGNVRSK
jgi:hypothetical protein